MKVIVVRGYEDQPLKVFTVQDDIAVEYMNGPSPPEVYEVLSDNGRQMILQRQEIDPASEVREDKIISADFRNAT